MQDYNLLKENDPELYAAVADERERQRNKIELIASENFVSETVMEASRTILTNKYAEGYPAKRYYGGCEHVDVVETIAIERAKKLFGAEHANVQFDKTFASKLARVKEAAIEDPFADNEDDPDNAPKPAEGTSSVVTANGGVAPAGMTGSKEEDLYNKALEVVRLTKRASTSHLQRRMGIGYNHAARLIDLLEDRGIIGPAKNAGPRDILVDLDAPAESVMPAQSVEQASVPADGSADGQTETIIHEFNTPPESDQPNQNGGNI